MPDTEKVIELLKMMPISMIADVSEAVADELSERLAEPTVHHSFTSDKIKKITLAIDKLREVTRLLF